MFSPRRRIGLEEIALWMARLLCGLSFALLALFVVAHLFEAGPQPTSHEWLGLTFFPAGVMLGLLLAVFSPIAGGLVASLAMLAFYVWHFQTTQTLPSGPFFLLFATPAIAALVLRAFQKHKKTSTRNPTTRDATGVN